MLRLIQQSLHRGDKMTEEHFRSIRRIVCENCGREVRAVASVWVTSLGVEGRAYLTDEEIAKQFKPEKHTLPDTNMWCLS